MKFDLSEFEDSKSKSVKKPTVVFCLPGKDFTQGFFNSWTKLLYFLYMNPIMEVHIVNYYLSNISQFFNS